VLYKKETHDLCTQPSLPSHVMVVKSRGLRRPGHVSNMAKTVSTYNKISEGNPLGMP
jgi:hypothetical protein